MPDKPKILVVDDTPENIQILMETLRDDYSVVVATDGEKALRLLTIEPRPDVVLLDIMMPGMSGYEVCLKIKSNPATWSIPVLFVTALQKVEDESRGLAVGAVDYITKPFNPNLVKARVRSHVELKHHRDHLGDLVAARTRELNLTQEVTILTLANLAETRDPETGGHIRRTQSYVHLLAEWLAANSERGARLDATTIDLLYKSAPLHDVGKVGVPDQILLKPARLTAAEFEEMKRHTTLGWSALHAAQKRLGENSFLHLAAEIAHCHHEKWDGSGYPRGLKGEEIPLSGRLMALADVYDALVSRRVYKSAWSHLRAMEVIRRGAGNHLDPVLVSAFLQRERVFRDIAIEFADSPEEREMVAAPA